MLLHSINPDGHAQALFWQVCPPEHALPQAPQFELSVARVMHCPLQSVWTLPQVVPLLVGFAQLAARSARLKQAASADKKVLLTFMVRLLQLGAVSGYRDIGGYPTAAAQIRAVENFGGAARI